MRLVERFRTLGRAQFFESIKLFQKKKGFTLAPRVQRLVCTTKYNMLPNARHAPLTVDRICVYLCPSGDSCCHYLLHASYVYGLGGPIAVHRRVGRMDGGKLCSELLLRGHGRNSPGDHSRTSYDGHSRTPSGDCGANVPHRHDGAS